MVGVVINDDSPPLGKKKIPKFGEDFFLIISYIHEASNICEVGAADVYQFPGGIFGTVGWQGFFPLFLIGHLSQEPSFFFV